MGGKVKLTQKVGPFHLELKNIPLYYTVGKKKPKKVGLNLNIFRNSHYFVLNNIKKQVHAWVRAKNLIPVTAYPLRFEYTIYCKTKRRADLGNIGSVVDKFVSDGLVEAGVIKDDNTDYIREIVYIDGGVKNDNSHANLVIKAIDL